MISNFDPTQETFEEYLRRLHLKDKLNAEWKNDQEKEPTICSICRNIQKIFTYKKRRN